MTSKSEFTVSSAHSYNQSSPTRWIISHILRYKSILAGFIFLALLTNLCYALIPTLMGVAFTTVVQRQMGQLGLVAMLLLGLALAQGALELGAHFSGEVIGER